MLRRTGFKRPERPAKVPVLLQPLVQPVNYARISANDAGPAVAKENPLTCEAYRELVRAMPCMHCGRGPRSQFCHGDQGKGMGLKTDDRTGWPGCGPDLATNAPGCHWLIGTSGQIPKEERRALEKKYAAQTRAAVLASGKWPKNLPLWKEIA
ncbi:MAG TPA: hypothetical protein DDX06_13680 [Curvibacter sp.]|nr:hypothetical protein [Curvibacter sp.]